MEIQLPEEQRSVIENLVASGRFSTMQDAVVEGVRLLAASENLRSQIQIGIDQADRGDVHEHKTVFQQLRAMATQAAASSE